MSGSAHLLLILFIVVLQQVFSQKIVPDLPDGPIITECRQKFPIEKDRIRGVLSHEETPNDKITKCFLACAYERYGLIKNGTADWERCRSAMKSFWPDKADHEKIDKVVEECKKQDKQDISDVCELAFAISLCKKTQGDKFGLQHLLFTPKQPVTSTKSALSEESIKSIEIEMHKEPVKYTTTVPPHEPVQSTNSTASFKPVPPKEPVLPTTTVPPKEPVVSTTTVTHKEPVVSTTTVTHQEPVESAK